MVIPSLAEAEKVYEFLCPAALIVPDNVWPQSIGVWAYEIKGSNMIAPEIRIKIKDHDLDLDVIFRSSVMNAFSSLLTIASPESLYIQSELASPSFSYQRSDLS